MSFLQPWSRLSRIPSVDRLASNRIRGKWRRLKTCRCRRTRKRCGHDFILCIGVSSISLAAKRRFFFKRQSRERSSRSWRRSADFSRSEFRARVYDRDRRRVRLRGGRTVMTRRKDRAPLSRTRKYSTSEIRAFGDRVVISTILSIRLWTKNNVLSWPSTPVFWIIVFSIIYFRTRLDNVRWRILNTKIDSKKSICASKNTWNLFYLIFYVLLEKRGGTCVFKLMRLLWCFEC